MSQCSHKSQRYICQEHWGLQLLESWLSPPPPGGRDLLKATRLLGAREQEVLFITNFRYFTGNYGGSGDNPAVNTAPCQELIPDLGPPFLASLGVLEPFLHSASDDF